MPTESTNASADVGVSVIVPVCGVGVATASAKLTDRWTDAVEAPDPRPAAAGSA